MEAVDRADCPRCGKRNVLVKRYWVSRQFTYILRKHGDCYRVYVGSPQQRASGAETGSGQ